MEANALDRTYAYFYDGSNWQISLPRIPKDDPIVSSLLAIRPFIIRIGIAFEKVAAIKFLFATGILLNQHLALTCPYHFDPIQWAGQRIPLTKIYVCAADPANPALFSLTKSNASVIEATLLQRGLHKDRMAKWKALEDDTSDLAIIRLVKSAAHLHVDDHFDPKFDSSLLSKSISIPIFLIGINGEFHDYRDLIPYRYINGFANVTIDQLNNHHQVNRKSVSLGRLLGEFPSQKQYAMHNCTSLAESSGSVTLDSTERFLGIHCGVSNSRQDKDKEFFFTEDTFNKFLSVDTTEFHEFIREAILPNIDNKQQAEKWQQSLTK